ncbi:MAG TPA: TonB-dependent receptor [Spongiibacteraceae bacterium]|nr:TonB-dependent receptor [Spongiibacteraceae bacterium]
MKRAITPVILTLATCCSLAVSSEVNPSLPNILTPARLHLPRTQVPASVTVLDSELIVASGIRELPELFRLVPGMSVGARDGWNYAVAYHGTNYRDSRRMQVLVDGRSVYQPGLATIDWTDLPLAIQDIERIEVVRGADTAAYGANAFLGVINIITRAPVDSARYRLSARGGNGGVEDYYASTSQPLGDGFLRISASARRDHGFDVTEDGADRRDSKNLEFLQFHYQRQTVASTFSLQGGAKQGEVTEDLFDETMVNAPKKTINDYFITSRLESHVSANRRVTAQLNLQGQEEETDWVSCLAPSLLGIVSATPLVCGDVNEDVDSKSIDLELQDQWFFDNGWQLVYGVNLDRRLIESDTYYGGQVQRNAYQLFVTMRAAITEALSATLGGTQEYEQTVGKNFSPRIALNYLIAPTHSLRFVFSKAIRAPDIFETHANWTYTARNLRPQPGGQTGGQFIVTAQGNPDLKNEEVIGREVGYYGHWQSLGLELDVKIFHDSYSELISENLALLAFDVENSNSLTQRGYEIEANWQLNPRLRLRATYATIDSETSANREKNFTPNHSHSALMDYQFSPRWRVSLAHYYSKPINTNTFSRIDLRLARDWHWQAWAWQLAATVQHRRDTDGDIFKDNRYKQDTRFYVTLETSF